MNHKSRGHVALNVCMAFIVIGGALYFLAGVLGAFGILLGIPERDLLSAFVGVGLAFSMSLLSFTLAGMIHLFIQIADDLYMLRLIAVNAYRHLPPHQLPPNP